MSGTAVPFDMRHAVPVAARLLALRLEATAELPLRAIRDSAPALVGLAPALAVALRRHACDLRAELLGPGAQLLARMMGRGLTQHLLRRNQYLPLPSGWDATAEDLYAELLDDLATRLQPGGEPSLAVAAHQARLRGLLKSMGAQALPAIEPPCANYSSELQMAVLGVDRLDLPGPILDLGCGAKGDLVRELRFWGRCDAWGIDPLCETGGPLLRESWFEAPLDPGTWGTILAHQSFSLHVLRAHTGRSETEASRLVRLYMRILRALKPGGSFRYAPALPFLEDLLPADHWRVERWHLGTLGPAGQGLQSARVSPRGLEEANAIGRE